MRRRYTTGVMGLAAVAAVGLAMSALVATPVAGQGPAVDQGLRRTADGKPDLGGIWQALNTAHWDLEDHAARQGPLIALGAAYSVPGGQGVVEGGAIPYQPAALAKKKANMQNALTLDPEVKCFMPGVPRAMYMPYPFQILQTPTVILMAFEFANAVRTVYVNSDLQAPSESWMGWSIGHWEGDTLVVTVTDFNDATWFDRAGNFHSNALKVVERYTPISRDVLNYEATIEDPGVFTRPWKITMPLYRRLEKNAQLLEYKCVEFAEPLMYGRFRKPGLK